MKTDREHESGKTSLSTLQKNFIAGALSLLDSMGWGSQKKIADKANIQPSTMNDIIKGRRFGSERTRRDIAQAFGFTYENLLKLGATKRLNKTTPLSKQCGDDPLFSEKRACCIYQFAAEQAGIMMSHFFTDDALKSVRPPGWVSYLDKQLGDDELYNIALEEMTKLHGLS